MLDIKDCIRVRIEFNPIHERLRELVRIQIARSLPDIVESGLIGADQRRPGSRLYRHIA